MAAHAEGKIEGYLVRRCRAHGALCLKQLDHRGVPDRLVLVPGGPGAAGAAGRYFFVEVKTPSGRLSPVQEYEIGRLRERGHTVYVVRSRQDVDDLLRGEGLGG